MSNIKSFKKYSWLISFIFAVITLISGLTINDLSFLPVEYQAKAVGVIGACAIIIKIIPENYRVKIAELLILQDDDQPAPETSVGDEDEQ